MAYANNDGIRIYYETVGKGQPLLLQHGFCQDHTNWSSDEENWVEALKNDFRLILVDARGHGASDKPHRPHEYQLLKMASDIVAVLDDLHLKKAHYLGYSMGGGIGFAAACYAPDRFFSFVIGGASAEDDLTEESNPIIPVFKEGPQAVVHMIEELTNGIMRPDWRRVLLANDYEALIAMCEYKERNGYEQILPSINVPCLIYAGDEDGCYVGAKRASELLPNASFLSVHGDHFAPDLINTLPHIKKFLKEVGQR